MSLGTAEAVVVATAAWTALVTVAGDGVKQTIGYIAACDDATVAFQARLSSPAGTRRMAQMQLPAGQSAVAVDAPWTIPNAQNLILEVQHAAGVNKNFSGTILGS
jgi:hypothetical protein